MADMEYPQRVAFAILTKLLEDFTDENGTKISQDKGTNQSHMKRVSGNEVYFTA